jgi:DNA replication protein DnaC
MSLEILKEKGMELTQPSSCFIGPVGTGKTTCLELIARKYGARVINYGEVNRLYSEFGHKATWHILKSHRHLFLDDVQKSVIKSFGTEIESPYELLLRARLDEILDAKARINSINLDIERIDREFAENKYDVHSHYFTGDERESYMQHREWLISKQESWQNVANSRVFFSTNIPIDNFDEIFSTPLIDRILSEIRIVKFAGESKRNYIN